MAKKGSGTGKRRKGLSAAQKRRASIVKALGQWNRKRDKANKLSRTEFWVTYRERLTTWVKVKFAEWYEKLWWLLS